ncbi:MAG: hypothetical protein HDQ87_07220 [Clostridia bacterium]|nr:hypothetical protein [Clostridia bacterium]
MTPVVTARVFLRCLRADLRRALGGWLFWTVVGLIVVFQLLDMSEEYLISLRAGGSSAVYLFSSFAWNNALLFMCLAMLPAALSFCTDWEHQFIRSSMIRSGQPAYSWSKVAATAVSAFLAVFLANIVTASLLASRLPALPAYAYEEGYNVYQPDAIGSLAMESPWIYYIAESAVRALACMSWAVFALFISTCMPNRLVVLAVPVIIFYAITYFVLLPPILTPTNLMNGTIGSLEDSPGRAIAYLIVLNTLMIAVWGILFSKNIRRRIAGD